MKIKALHACNGGGKPMIVGEVYDVPDRDGYYLVNAKKAELVQAKVKKPEAPVVDKTPPAPSPGLSTKTGPK